MIEPTEAVFIRTACEDARQKVVKLKESAGKDKSIWYDFVSKWIDDVEKTAIVDPDPFMEGRKKDWGAEFDRVLSLEDESALREEAVYDMKNIRRKLDIYKGLVRNGHNAVANIMEDGMIRRSKGDNIDYNLLSLLEPVRDVERQLRGSIAFMNTVSMRNGMMYKSMEPEIYGELVDFGRKIDERIEDFMHDANKYSHAVKLAKEGGLTARKIPSYERDQLLEHTFEDMMFQSFANDMEGIINAKMAELPGVEYIKFRLMRRHGTGAYSIKGESGDNAEWGNMSYGVEVVARAGDLKGIASARADVGGELPFRTMDAKGKIEEAIKEAYESATHNANMKLVLKGSLSKAPSGAALTESISDYGMVKTPVDRATIRSMHTDRPDPADNGKMYNYVTEIAKESMEFDKTVQNSIVLAISEHERELIIDSDGRKIDMSHPRSYGLYWTVAKTERGMSYSRYDAVGGTGNIRDILEDGKNDDGMSLHDFAIRGTKETVNLARAEYFPEALAYGTGKLNVYEKDGKLCTDGTIIPTGKEPQHEMKHKVLVEADAGWLMLHETCPLAGHSGETNRWVGKRNDTSGRSIYGDFNKTKLGEKVASELITAYFNRGALGGIDQNEYDDEGTPTGEIIVVDKGIAKNAMVGRATGYQLKMQATGCMTAINATNKEMERMGFNSIKPGNTPDEKLIEMLDGEEGGYMLLSIDIPAINAGRTAAHFGMGTVIPVVNGKIVYYDDKNNTGEPKPLVYRGVGIMYDTRDFWDTDMIAVGNKAKRKMCLNCGNAEGNEMQAKKMTHEQPRWVSKVKMTPGADNFMGYEGMVNAISNYMDGLKRGAW